MMKGEVLEVWFKAWSFNFNPILGMETKSKKRRLYRCGHCDELISKTLYFQHKRLYYSVHNRQWKKISSVACDCSGQESPVSDFIIPVDQSCSDSDDNNGEVQTYMGGIHIFTK